MRMLQRLTEETRRTSVLSRRSSLRRLVEEFWELLETQSFMVHGGLDFANRLTGGGPFGKQRGQRTCWPWSGTSQEGVAGQTLAKLQAPPTPSNSEKLLDSENIRRPSPLCVLAHLDPRKSVAGS